jgi:UDP-N-acetylglucosamine--N-acetylmuramyl-(pentapeptide) pyrophosphoryl-undecaprenol N-acetylglucosamine transferase
MRVIMAGGATGGHLYPALAVAEKIKRKEPGSEILFIADDNKHGLGIIKEAGYEYRIVDIAGFDRKHLLRNAGTLAKLAIGSRSIYKIIEEFKPDAALGTGGYICGPVIRCAAKKGIPAFIHEQNVIPGVANRLAERYASRVFTAFEHSKEYFKDRSKLIVTGNPVRRPFITSGATDYRTRLGIPDKTLPILCFGGSLGAEKLNEVFTRFVIATSQFVIAGSDPQSLPSNTSDVNVFFITGKTNYTKILTELSEAGLEDAPNLSVMDYTEIIHEYYAAADIIISRSGALTISEIAVMGKPSILIPSPNVTGNHQYYNAQVLASQGAAIIIEEKDLTAEKLETEVRKLAANRSALNRMADAARKIGRPDATDVIYDHIRQAVHG